MPASPSRCAVQRFQSIALSSSRSLTTTLGNQIARATMLLTDRLDGLMEQFQGDGSSFYADCQNARKIIDNVGSKKVQPEPATP